MGRFPAQGSSVRDPKRASRTRVTDHRITRVEGFTAQANERWARDRFKPRNAALSEVVDRNSVNAETQFFELAQAAESCATLS
jgi:hypothetical protein